MQLNRPNTEPAPATQNAQPPRTIITEPKFELPIKPIAELVTDPDFPKSALGQHVDIGGYPGVVVEIVKSSIKVRSSEGNMMSYNFNALRRLYGPQSRPEEPQAVKTPEPAPAASAPQVKRDVILNPNFEAQLNPIEEFVARADFPKCVFGQFVDLHGYTGVVVEIVGRSLKVRSREGSTRSYNADGLRKLYSNRHAGVLASMEYGE